MKGQTPLPSEPAVRRALDRLVQGSCSAAESLRSKVLEFCSNPLARTIYLHGEIGSGKSTLARGISFLKRIAPLAAADANRHVEDLKYDAVGRIDLRLMPWYVELSLTGLVGTLAESQLFGITSRAATGVKPRAGVFEAAATARGMADDAGAGVTGGVVFLDEIGDLPAELQSKLLPVLSGGVFCRIGAEGEPRTDLKAWHTYDGVTITASWKPIDEVHIRPDLLSRLSSYVVRVPSLEDRVSDIPHILRTLEDDIRSRYLRRIQELCRADPQVDRAYWSDRAAGLRRLDDADINYLATIQWSRHGNLRGLSSVVEQIVVGERDARAIVADLPIVSEEHTGHEEWPMDLLDRVLRRGNTGAGLAAHVRAIEIENRSELRRLLMREPALGTRLCVSLGISESSLPHQILQLDRARTGARRGRGK